MKIALLTGIFGGIVAGVLQYLSITVGITSGGGLLYYSPHLVLLACIYFSIKRTATNSGEISFKESLKAGGITAALIAFMIGVGFFVGLNNTDVPGLVQYMREQNMTSAEISKTLGEITKQNMMDRAKFWTMPFFLLGFLMTVGIAFILKRTAVARK